MCRVGVPVPASGGRERLPENIRGLVPCLRPASALSSKTCGTLFSMAITRTLCGAARHRPPNRRLAAGDPAEAAQIPRLEGDSPAWRGHATACRRQNCGGDTRRTRARSVIQNRDLSPKFFEERDTPPPVTSDDARALSVRVDRPLSEIAQDVEIAALTQSPPLRPPPPRDSAGRCRKRPIS